MAEEISPAFGRDERDRLIRLETHVDTIREDIGEIKATLQSFRDRTESREESHSERSRTTQLAFLSMLTATLASFVMNHLKF